MSKYQYDIMCYSYCVFSFDSVLIAFRVSLQGCEK